MKKVLVTLFIGIISIPALAQKVVPWELLLFLCPEKEKSHRTIAEAPGNQTHVE